MKRANKWMLLVGILTIVLVTVLGVACGSQNVADIAITGLPDANTAIITDEADTLQLGYELSPSNADGKVIWSSGDEAVASVNEKGLVTLHDGGVAVITVALEKDAQIKTDVALTVVDRRTLTDTIQINGAPDGKVDIKDETLQLTAECSDASATLKWTSSNESIATVNDSGLVTFRSTGKVDITVYKQGRNALRDTLTVTIARPVQSIEIAEIVSKDAIVGYDYRLQTTFIPNNADVFEVEWAVDDEAVAEITETGVLCGKTNGTVTVTAKVKGEQVSASKQFTVVKLNENSENFAYAEKGASTIVGEHTYNSLDYVGTRVTSEYLEFSLETEGNNRILIAQKTQENDYWTDLRLGSWNLPVGSYKFTLDMDVVEGEISGHVLPGRYSADGITTITGAAYGQLRDWGKEDGKYVLYFSVLAEQENFCMILGSNESAHGAYTIKVRSFSLETVDMNLAAEENFETGLFHTKAERNTGENLYYHFLYGGKTTVVVFGGPDMSVSLEEVDGKEGKSLKVNGSPVWEEVQIGFTDCAEAGKYRVSLYYNLAKGNHSFHYFLGKRNAKGAYDTVGGAYQVTGHNGGVATFDLTIPQDCAGEELALILGTNAGSSYTLYLDDFSIEKYAEISDAVITTFDDEDVIQSGANYDLSANVVFESGVTEGEGFSVEWSVLSAADGGSARILDGENGKKILQGLKPGEVTLKLTVTGDGGKVIETTLILTVELGNLAVNTDMYSDGLLVKGADYQFEPVAIIEGMEFSYAYKEVDGNDEKTGIVEVRDGRLYAKAAGEVRLVISSSFEGTPITKSYTLRVKEYGGWADGNYNDATNVKELGANVYDVDRTNVYLRTYNMKIEAKEGSLALSKDYVEHGWSEVVFLLGYVEAGTYAITFTLHGDDLVWNKLSGHVKTVSWKEGYESIFTTQAYTDGAILEKTIYQGDKEGNAYTVYVTVEKAQDNFGIALCSNTAVAYTVSLDAFSFEKLPAVTDATIVTNLQGNTIKTGEEATLTASVTYEGGADKGQEYTVEWKTTGTGEVRIADGVFTAVKPGAVTIELKVVCADGTTFTKTLSLTVEVGEIAIQTDMYGDGILVKGEEYSFLPEKFTDESAFEYSYSANGIVEVKDGKLVAKTAGAVTLTVTETVTGATKEIALNVLDFSGNADEDYRYAVNPVQHGDFYDVERTNVYVRSFNMNISVENNALKFTKAYVPAGGGSILFYLGNVEAGRYCVTVKLNGDLNWNAFRGYLYPLTWSENYETVFNDTAYVQGSNPYGNIHEAGVCLYSGGGDSTQGGTYTMYIDVAESSERFGLMLTTWETENKAFSVGLESFEFRSAELTKSFDFENTDAQYSFTLNGSEPYRAVVGQDNGMAITKNASDVQVVAHGGGYGLQVVAAQGVWTEIAFRFGSVKAGTYILSYEIEMTTTAGWFSGHIYQATFGSNQAIQTDASTIKESYGTVGGDTLSKTVTLEITLTEDKENFGIAVCTSCDAAAVTVIFDNVSLSPKPAE